MTAQEGRNDGGKLEGNGNPAGRNLRSVWTIPTQPCPEAHFATFPEALVRPCILAATSERGVCGKCGKPWERVMDKNFVKGKGSKTALHVPGASNWAGVAARGHNDIATVGWRPACRCEVETVPAVVLDPFAGSGTTLKVARDLGRIGWGIELKPEYCEMAAQRLQQEALEMVP